MTISVKILIELIPMGTENAKTVTVGLNDSRRQ